MGALEQINQMKNQGMDDETIMRHLQQSGFSQGDINEAFNQASIKRAVSSDPNQNQSLQGNPQDQGSFEDDDVYVPSPGQSQQSQYSQNQTQGQSPSQEDYYSPNQNYSYEPQEGDYYSPGSTDTGTIIEIAEQVVSEKMEDFQKTIDDLSEFKTLAESRMESMLERIKRLEKTFDILQVSILQKIGSYGSNLENIKKEMEMMQDSFGKVIPELAKKHSHNKPSSSKQSHKTPSKSKTKKRTSSRKKK